jgi:hypothetical protein
MQRFQVFVPGHAFRAGERSEYYDAIQLAESVSRATGKTVTVLDCIKGEMQTIEAPKYLHAD